MDKFWSDYLSASKCTANCKIISKDRKIKQTHRVLLAAVSGFLKTLLMDTFDEEDSCIYLPDFTGDELEEFMDKIFLSCEQDSSGLHSILGVEMSQADVKQYEAMEKCKLESNDNLLNNHDGDGDPFIKEESPLNCDEMEDSEIHSHTYSTGRYFF